MVQCVGCCPECVIPGTTGADDDDGGSRCGVVAYCGLWVVGGALLRSKNGRNYVRRQA